MKKMRLFTLCLSAVMMGFIYSCAPEYGAHFQQSRHDAPDYASKSKDDKLKETEKTFVSINPNATAKKFYIKEVDKALMDKLSDIEKNIEISNEEEVVEKEVIQREKEKLVLEAVKSKLSGMSKEEKKAFKKEVKEFAKEQNLNKDNIYSTEATSDVSESTLLLVLITILLPPLGVYLHEDEINSKFWISLLLTLLFYFPGLIYSLIVVLE